MATKLKLEERTAGTRRALVLVDQDGDVVSGLVSLDARSEAHGGIEVIARFHLMPETPRK